jgi:uncharacterized membrane protein
LQNLSEMTFKLERYNPAVKKEYLIMLAGIMWCGVGVMLISFAMVWLSRYTGTDKFYYYGAGFLAAMPIHHFGFLRLADKNLKRLLPVTGKRCVFSFVTWKSYLIIIIMVAMGITLRHSPIPKQYLSIVYNGIGLGLFLSGIRYIRSSIRLFSAKQ